MADIPLGAPSGGARTSSTSIASMANWAGAAVSMALLVGVGVWGYKLLVRDVTGIPVVRAAEGPMRVAPTDPGGKPAEHQGLAVNSVAGTGAAEPPADRLVLAPRPVNLSDEDLPQTQALQAARPVPRPAPLPEQDIVTAPPAPQAETSQQMQSIQALADAIAGEAEPLTDIGEIDETAAVKLSVGEQESASTVTIEPVPATGLRSPRPKLRPQGLQTASLSTVEPAAASSLDVDPASIAVGTRLVQLGAYDSAEVARSEWERLAGRFGDYMDGKQRVIQKASSGGRTFYRLRAMGFADLSDARRFCSALVAENADCIPVVTR